jgi:hypothetical protein
MIGRASIEAVGCLGLMLKLKKLIEGHEKC